MRIDSHQHFWKYSKEEYDWIPIDSPLHRDYGPTDLKPNLDRSKIDGCIAVQARQSIAENDYLCGLADQFSFIKGVVGWIDLRSNEVDEQAARFKRQSKAVGVRHVVQGEEDPEFMAREPFRRGIRSLRNHDLVYDILIYAHQLPDAIRLVKAFPDQSFVLDHIAKPKIKAMEIREWSSRIIEISHYSNVVVKLSGIVTEADPKNWTFDQLVPYWEVIAQAFGPERIMFGSDWPVLRLASEYDRWVEIVSKWLEKYSRDEQELIWGTNAERVYLSKLSK